MTCGMYIENPKESMNKKKKSRANEFRKVAVQDDTKYSSVSLYQQYRIQKGNSENSSIYNSIRSIQKSKYLYSENYITVLEEIKTQVNGKIFFVYGLENLVLLRWQYYAKECTCLV